MTRNLTLSAVLLAVLVLICSEGCRPPAQQGSWPANTTAPGVVGDAENTSPPDNELGADELGADELGANAPAKKASSVEKSPFGETSDGTQVHLFTCTNANGAVMKLITFGATVTSLEVPDRRGAQANVTLGFENLDGYLQRHPYFGSTVGRFCNRIANGHFTLEGTDYQLSTNLDPHHLHGGNVGFDAVVWDAQVLETAESVGVVLTYHSPDGEEGYPGNLQVTVTYSLDNDNELLIEFLATTDKATPVNLTNHNYWNLSGAGSGSVLDQQVMIAADEYLETDPNVLPTGRILPVKDTPLDFTLSREIGERIGELPPDEAHSNPGGYDHCFVLRQRDGGLRLAARIRDPGSGRVMEIHTTQPGIQFYTGNFLDGSPIGNGYEQHEGFCLETQHYPDSPNHAEFPSAILQPGETYRQLTVHRFYTD